ncbi:MAG TPA: AAA family ATPase [Methanoregulaceae archaeon]|nr:AAA family ATPase [Methanoregulaceae archaeon]HQJ88339.1 AAA family ATPase [Methanoregulaceae archaeon]
MITSLSLENFRSFQRVEFHLRPFVVLVGRNAAGKTNLLQGFIFLRDIARSGLANAISLQGGLPFVQNAELACGRELKVAVELTLPTGESPRMLADGRTVFFSPGPCRYSFSIGCGDQPEILSDRFFMQFTVGSTGDEGLPGWMEIVHEGGAIRYRCESPEGIQEEAILPPPLREEGSTSGTLLLESPTLYPMGLVRRGLAKISCYEFGPRLPGRLDFRTGAAELAEDGSNAAIALGRVLAHPDSRRQFLRLVHDLLPFVEDVRVGDGPGGTPAIRVSEIYAPGRYFPAEVLSSGTVELFALLTALFFSPRELAIFEEPAARLHPALVERLVQLMREASVRQPIIVSTQHPALLRHAPPESVYLVSRDERGFSTLSRPVDRPEVQTFLEEEVGLDDLFLTDLL